MNFKAMNNTIIRRNHAIDALRVFACLLVIWQHASEFYYIGAEGVPVRETSTYIIGFITSLCRAAVPLFVIASGYFVLPMQDSNTEFFKRRAMRIVGPFLFWGTIYAVYYMFSRGDSLTQCLKNVASLPINFGTEIGHMWYVYMLIGLYLIVPIVSPWLQSVSKRALQRYLGIWGVTTVLPYIHLIFPEIWGECFWNPTPMLYYFNGFIGYFILGFYIRRFGAPEKLISLTLILIGYAITALVFNSRIETAADIPSLELSWQQCSGNVALMAFGIFSLFTSLKMDKSSTITNFIGDASLKGYAMYLAHMIILGELANTFIGKYNSVLIEIPLLSILTFILTYTLVKLLSMLPKSKYWLG